jgi:ferric-dicitrate binding protein FerR (iron transport regulator)
MEYRDASRLPIMEEAAEWHLRLQDGDMPSGKRLSYLYWLKTSPVHIAEMLRMGELERRLRGAGLRRL